VPNLLRDALFMHSKSLLSLVDTPTALSSRVVEILKLLGAFVPQLSLFLGFCSGPSSRITYHRIRNRCDNENISLER
jgi:hypothetical protein